MNSKDIAPIRFCPPTWAKPTIQTWQTSLLKYFLSICSLSLSWPQEMSPSSALSWTVSTGASELVSLPQHLPPAHSMALLPSAQGLHHDVQNPPWAGLLQPFPLCLHFQVGSFLLGSGISTAARAQTCSLEGCRRGVSSEGRESGLLQIQNLWFPADMVSEKVAEGMHSETWNVNEAIHSPLIIFFLHIYHNVINSFWYIAVYVYICN